MVFYETDSARTVGLDKDVVDLTINRLSRGFAPWLIKEQCKRISLSKLVPDNAISIIFICEDDLGKTKNISSIATFDMLGTIIINYHGKSNPTKFIERWNINNVNNNSHLKEIFIPEDQEFKYDDSGRNKNDYLGIYYNYSNTSPRACIFIRVDRITKDVNLGIFPTEGICSVVLHELGHAFLDIIPQETLKCSDSSFTSANLRMLDYIIEEAIANAFSYRAMKSTHCRENGSIMTQINNFMLSQPKEYAFGRELARGTDTVLLQIFIKWCQIKCGRVLQLNRNLFYNIYGSKWPLSTTYVQDFQYFL